VCLGKLKEGGLTNMKYYLLIVHFIRDLYKNKFIIKELVKRDINSSYIGSFLGIFWTFLHPFALTLIFMLVFGFGFKSPAPYGNVPFFVWFLAGYIPWIFFSTTLEANTQSIINFSFLVKKINFRISTIPLIKIFSNIIIFSIYLFSLGIFLLLFKVPFHWLWFQLIYYIIAMLFLITGSSFLLSSTNIFIKDIANINNIFLQLGFFATPIFWKIEDVNPMYAIIFKLNPMAYIVQGFRESLFYQIPFWHNPFETLYFWGVSSIIMIIGIIVFSKLRPHFADVL
jgi:ABC-type polysaccharide/polyol phosphate export permease